MFELRAHLVSRPDPDAAQELGTARLSREDVGDRGKKRETSLGSWGRKLPGNVAKDVKDPEENPGLIKRKDVENQ